MEYYFSNLSEGVVLYTDKGTITVPKDEDNRDWQTYLQFVEAGGLTKEAID